MQVYNYEDICDTFLTQWKNKLWRKEIAPVETAEVIKKATEFIKKRSCIGVNARIRLIGTSSIF